MRPPRPPNPELVEHFRSHLLPPAVDTAVSLGRSLARLRKAIDEESERKDSEFVTCCLALIPVVWVRSSLPAGLKERADGMEADLTKALQAADVPAIFECAKSLGERANAVRLDRADVCESLLYPRLMSSDAVERAMAPARTLLVAMLWSARGSEQGVLAAVQRLFDLLGLDETRDLCRAAVPHLLDVARRVSMTLWSVDDYRMIEACAVAMATLHFEKPATETPMPRLERNTLDWGDGSVRLQRTQLRLAELLLEHPTGVTPKQLEDGRITSQCSSASRLRKTLKSASCPWTVLHTDGKYMWVRATR